MREVRAACDAEAVGDDAVGDVSDRAETIAALKQTLLEMEEALMALGPANAPSLPFRAEHADSAVAFDQAWLIGTWRPTWGRWLPSYSDAWKADFAQATSREIFKRSGAYIEVSLLGTRLGYYCVVPGPGRWCTVVRYYPEVREGRQIVTNRAYRVDDKIYVDWAVTWIRAD